MVFYDNDFFFAVHMLKEMKKHEGKDGEKHADDKYGFQVNYYSY